MTADGKLDKVNGMACVEKLKPVDAELYEKCAKVMEKCFDETSEVDDFCETAAIFATCLKNGAKEVK